MLTRMIGFYVDNLPSRSSINVTLEGQRVPVETVKKGAGNMDRLLLFDLEKAWGSMKLTAAESGVVSVVLTLP